MGRDTNAGRAGRGGNSGRGGRGQGGRGRGANATMPRKASEVGAWKELEGHIFTIGSGNKGKDGDIVGVYTVMVCRWTDHILSLNLKRKDLSRERQFPH